MIDWTKLAPWILVVVASGAAIFCFNAYLSERDAFNIFKTEVKIRGEVAEENKKETEAKYAATLKKVKTYEKSIPTLRANASINYGMRFGSGSGSVPITANGIKLDDGASQKSMVDRFAKDCGEDAAKLEAWREWGRLNSIPVE